MKPAPKKAPPADLTDPRLLFLDRALQILERPPVKVPAEKEKAA
jgi:hypothetical protein